MEGEGAPEQVLKITQPEATQTKKDGWYVTEDKHPI